MSKQKNNKMVLNPNIDWSVLVAYAGRWVALVNEPSAADTTYNVAGVGHSGPEALRIGRRNRPKEVLDVRYVPNLSGRPLLLSELLLQLEPVFAQLEEPVYLVGGAVRDAIMGHVTNDLDFVVPQNGIKVAYRIGDLIKAPAYPLDRERDVGRVVLADANTYLDIATFRGESIEDDLYDRDLTFNAMAMPALARTTAEVIDPHDGMSDIKAGRVRQVHGRSLTNDPVRGLRALRMRIKYQFELDSATRDSIAFALKLLDQSSQERQRDELIKLVDVNAAEAFAWLQEHKRLADIFPLVEKLHGVTQSSPHVYDVFDHTLAVLSFLPHVIASYVEGQKVDNVPLDQSVHAADIREHLNRPINGNVSGITSLRWAALLHDIGKPQTRMVEEPAGRIRFIGHETVGTELSKPFLREWRFSNEFVNHTATIVRGHMRPLLFAQEPALSSPSARAMHRFFRSYGAGGIDICLLALADHLGTYGGVGVHDQWQKLCDVVGKLLNHYFLQESAVSKRKPLLNGQRIMELLNIRPSKVVGYLVRALAEAQAIGEVTTIDQAEDLVQRLYAEKSSH